MIPASFDYELAESPEHAVELLAAHDDAKLLAGGHSLLPLMKLRVVRPSLLVDVGRLRELAYVREQDGGIAVGSATRHGVLERDSLLRSACPLLAFAAGLVGDPQVRHRGTLGGSLAHGDPAGDLPAVVLALGGRVTALGRAGTRTIQASELFPGPFTTALAPDELLTELWVPRLEPADGWAYVKHNRRALDWATVGVAVVVRRGGGGAIDSAAIALANMGATPLRAEAAERALRDVPAPDVEEAVAAAAARADEEADPPDDASASAPFRRHLARVLVRRALEQALAPAY